MLRRFFARLAGIGKPDPQVLFEQIASEGFADGFDRHQSYRVVFLATPLGRKVLNDILTQCHMFHPVVVPGDPFLTHFRDGERNAGLRILTALNAAPIATEEDEPNG